MRWKRGNRLKLVSESAAPGPTREIFREVRESLGVPAVPKLYQAYAALPEFLELHWRAFRPALQSRQFFLLGARLAAESYTRAHNYFDVPSLHPPEADPQAPDLSISQVLDYYQYLDPLLLLISAAQMQAFEGPVGQPQEIPEPAYHPEFALSPSLLSDGRVGVGLQPAWQERQRALDPGLISDEHCALASWPEFYSEYWAALWDLLQSPVYADCQYRLADSALNMASELPVRVETSISQLLDGGLDDEQITAVVRINEASLQALTGVVLDVTFARIGLETTGKHGPHQGPTSDPAAQQTGSPVRAA